MQKMLLILNPRAGQRKANRQLSDIVSIFNRADYDVTVYITAAGGDARTQTAQRAKEMDLVVCCGGDGTFQETVAGLLESGANTPLGYIPAGSTNDFASSLGLPTNPLDAAKKIVNGKPTPFDAGAFQDRVFTYVASFGAFTRVSYATPQNVKNALGHLAYLLGGISELGQIRDIHVKMDIGEETLEGDYLFGAICNSTSLGGIAKLDPNQVDLSDGKFELFLIRAPKDLSELTECLAALQTKQYNCRMMTFRTVESLTVTTDGDVPWTLDGEMATTNGPTVVNNLHHAFRLQI